jgi:arabinofuranosyltransferase
MSPMNLTESRLRWVSAALGAIVIVLYMTMVWQFWEQRNDDAFITFRYSRFLADGYGPIFNIGERVEGYTNFLLMLIVAGGIRLLGPDFVLLYAQLICIGGGILAICCTYALAASWLRSIDTAPRAAQLLGWIAAALVAIDAFFAQNSSTGLETTLFAGFVVLGVWLDQLGRERGAWRGAGIAFAVAALTRPEGAVAFAALVAGRLIIGEGQNRDTVRRLALDIASVAAVVGAHLMFRHSFYGEWLPNTYYAKTGGHSWNTSAKEYVIHFLVESLGVVLAVCAALPLAAVQERIRKATVPALIVVGSSILSVFLNGADWMPGHRVLIPYLPLWSALAVAGVLSLAPRIMDSKRIGATLVGGAALVAGMYVWQWQPRERLMQHVLVRGNGYRNAHIPLGDLLGRMGKPGETVALMDIGQIGYMCPNLRILDVTGLTDRQIAKSPGTFLDKEYDPAYVLDQKPEYIVVALRAPQTASGFDPAETGAWTRIEQRFFENPDFLANYFRARPAAEDDPDLVRVAKLYGAERAFLHDYPGAIYYFLLLYVRSETPASAPATASAPAE